mgnify:CR=1 FL=1
MKNGNVGIKEEKKKVIRKRKGDHKVPGRLLRIRESISTENGSLFHDQGPIDEVVLPMILKGPVLITTSALVAFELDRTRPEAESEASVRNTPTETTSRNAEPTELRHFLSSRAPPKGNSPSLWEDQQTPRDSGGGIGRRVLS